MRIKACFLFQLLEQEGGGQKCCTSLCCEVFINLLYQMTASQGCSAPSGKKHEPLTGVWELFNVSLWYNSSVTGVPQLLNSLAYWLIDKQLVQSDDKAISVSKSRVTNGLPQKGSVMWRSRVWASPNTICISQQTHFLCTVSDLDDIWRKVVP